MIHILPPADELDKHPEKLYTKGFGDSAQNTDDTTEDDILNRKELGRKLSNIVENIDDPLTIALNGGWGSGKTWFLKHWAGEHELESHSKALTVYISAFNHDYLEDPLPAIIGTIDERIKGTKGAIEDAFDAVKAWGSVLALIAIRLGLAAATTGISEIVGFIASDAIKNISQAAVKEAGDQAKESFKKYWQEEEGKRAAMQNLKKAIEKFAKTQPLVIIIDELDRAKPDYALSILETIKHFFGVSGIKFILGVNLTALDKMVMLRYGLDETNARKYLERFINFSVTLPDTIQTQQGIESNAAAYCIWAIENMSLNKEIGLFFLNHIKAISRNNSIALRDAQRILSKFILIAVSIGDDNFLNMPAVTAEILICLLSSEIISPKFYTKFSEGTISKEETLKYYGANTPEYARLEEVYQNWIKQTQRYDQQYSATAGTALEFLRQCKFGSLLGFLNSQDSRESDYSKYPAFMWIQGVPRLGSVSFNRNSQNYIQKARGYLDLFNLNLASDASEVSATSNKNSSHK